MIAEDALQTATAEAKKEKVSLVSYLVGRQMADSRDIALAACHEFGVPIIDLEALELDIEVVRLVDQEIGSHVAVVAHREPQCSCCSRCQIDGALDLRPDRRVVEEVSAQEKRLQDRLELVVVLSQYGRELVDDRLVRILIHEFTVEFATDELCRDGLVEDDVRDVDVIPFAGPAQEGLLTRVPAVLVYP